MTLNPYFADASLTIGDRTTYEYSRPSLTAARVIVRYAVSCMHSRWCDTPSAPDMHIPCWLSPYSMLPSVAPTHTHIHADTHSLPPISYMYTYIYIYIYRRSLYRLHSLAYAVSHVHHLHFQHAPQLGSQHWHSLHRRCRVHW